MIHRLHNDKSIRLCLYSFRVDTKSYPVSGRYHEYEQQRHRTGASRSHIGIQHPAGKVGREGLVKWIPVLTAEYLLPSQWIPVLTPTYALPLLSEYLFTLHSSVAQNLREISYVTHHFRDRHVAASLRNRNRAKITVLMCKQKPECPVWFSCRRKSYPG